MQAAKLPINAGWKWIIDGYQLFMRQPLAMFFWAMVTGLLITFSYFLPIIGQMILIAITPMLTFITLSACRTISAGQHMLLGMWLQPLRQNPDARNRLLKLGMVYLAFCMTAGIIATLPFLGHLRAAIGGDGTINEAALIAAIRGPFITFGLLYILISALFWHAPALTGWHGIRIGQAMFYSMVACWRNKLPFLAYGTGWAAVFFALQTIGSLLLAMGLSPGLTQILVTPLNLGLAAVLYCSFYPAYISVFGANYPTTSGYNPPGADADDNGSA